MRREAAKILVRLGSTLLVMALLVRLLERSRAELAADDLAVVASLAVVALGALFARFSPP